MSCRVRVTLQDCNTKPPLQSAQILEIINCAGSKWSQSFTQPLFVQKTKNYECKSLPSNRRHLLFSHRGKFMTILNLSTKSNSCVVMLNNEFNVEGCFGVIQNVCVSIEVYRFTRVMFLIRFHDTTRHDSKIRRKHFGMSCQNET